MRRFSGQEVRPTQKSCASRTTTGRVQSTEPERRRGLPAPSTRPSRPTEDGATRARSQGRPMLFRNFDATDACLRIARRRLQKRASRQAEAVSPELAKRAKADRDGGTRQAVRSCAAQRTDSNRHYIGVTSGVTGHVAQVSTPPWDRFGTDRRPIAVPDACSSMP
jgi:hypothetical protein